MDYRKTLERKLNYILFMLKFKSSFVAELSAFEVAVVAGQGLNDKDEIHERGTTFKMENLLDLLNADFEKWLKEKNISFFRDKNQIIFSKGKSLKI